MVAHIMIGVCWESRLLGCAHHACGVLPTSGSGCIVVHGMMLMCVGIGRMVVHNMNCLCHSALGRLLWLSQVVHGEMCMQLTLQRLHMAWTRSNAAGYQSMISLVHAMHIRFGCMKACMQLAQAVLLLSR
jgi:hypothetical protein